MVAPRPGITLAYRVNEGVPQVQSSGVRGAGCARAPTAPATAATALEPQIHRRYTRTTRTQHRGTNYTQLYTLGTLQWGFQIM